MVMIMKSKFNSKKNVQAININEKEKDKNH